MGPSKMMKNSSCSATILPGSTALPFVIPTGAQRSGEIRGSAALSWKYFFDLQESWASGPTRGDEKRLLFSNYSPSKRRPLLCHLDRSAAQWRDLRRGSPFLKMFFAPEVLGEWTEKSMHFVREKRDEPPGRRFQAEKD
jgi:hypothetical protein